MLGTLSSLLIQINAQCGLFEARRPSAHIVVSLSQARRETKIQLNASQVRSRVSFFTFGGCANKSTHFLMKGSDSRRTAMKLTLLCALIGDWQTAPTHIVLHGNHTKKY